MTSIALIHLRDPAALRHLSVLLAGDSFGNHVEMHHVVTGRCLMTLRAIEGFRRRMLKLLNGPLRGRVTARTVRSENSNVPILRRVARLAIESHLEGSQVGMVCGRRGACRMGGHPLLQLIRGLGIDSSYGVEFTQADACESLVIHLSEVRLSASMFDVALRAVIDTRVKCRRLPLQ